MSEYPHKIIARHVEYLIPASMLFGSGIFVWNSIFKPYLFENPTAGFFFGVVIGIEGYWFLTKDKSTEAHHD